MGRSSGGASHGGGGHSGGHSFGGRSGGGSSGGGRSGGGFSGGFGFGPSPGPGPRPYGGYRRPGYGGFDPGPPPPPGGPGRRRGGCSPVFVVILIIILLASMSSGLPSFYTHISQSGSKVEQSATERTAITGTKLSGTWYKDETGYINGTNDLIDGLKYFYAQTGIQPYVLFLNYDESLWNNGTCDESKATAYLEKVYNSTFSDNGHMILGYFSSENDSSDLNGSFFLYYGSGAYSIMDSEAESIFWSYFDKNYNNLDLSVGKFLGNTFEETAKNIMHVSGGFPLGQIIILGIVVVGIILVAVPFIVKRLMKKDKDDVPWES